MKEQVRYHISTFAGIVLSLICPSERMEWFLILLDLFFSVCVFSSVCLRVWHVLSKLVDCVIRLMRGNTNTSYFLSTAQSLQSSITFEFLKIFSLSQSSRNDEKLWKFYERVIPHYRVRWHPTTHDSHSLNVMLNKKVFGKSRNYLQWFAHRTSSNCQYWHKSRQCLRKFTRNVRTVPSRFFSEASVGLHPVRGHIIHQRNSAIME